MVTGVYLAGGPGTASMDSFLRLSERLHPDMQDFVPALSRDFRPVLQALGPIGGCRSDREGIH